MKETLVHRIRKNTAKVAIAGTVGLIGAKEAQAYPYDDLSPVPTGEHTIVLSKAPAPTISLEQFLPKYQEQETTPTATAIPNSFGINIRTQPSPNSEIVGTPSSEGISSFTLYGFIPPEHSGDGHIWYYSRVNGQNVFVQDGVVTLSTTEGGSLPDLSEALQLAQEMNVLDSRDNIIEDKNGLDVIPLEMFNAFVQQLDLNNFPEETLSTLSVFDTGLDSGWLVFKQGEQAGNNEAGSVFTVSVNNQEIETVFLPPLQTSADLEALGLPNDVNLRPTREEGVLQINDTISVEIEKLHDGTSLVESLIIREERASTGITIRPGEVDFANMVETHQDAPNFSVLGAVGIRGEFLDDSVLEQISSIITPDMFDNPAPIILSGGTEINESQLGSAIGYVNFMGSNYAVVACVVYSESISEPESVENQYFDYLPLFFRAENDAVNVYVIQTNGRPDPISTHGQWFMAANLTEDGYELLQQSTSDNPLDFADVTDMFFRISRGQREALIIDKLEDAEEGYNGSIVLTMIELDGDSITGIAVNRALAEGTIMPGANENGFIPREHTNDNIMLLGNLSQDYLNEHEYSVTGQEY